MESTQAAIKPEARWNILVGLVGVLIAADLMPCSAAIAADPLPNFVFVIADDVCPDDLGCYGHPTLKTPHLDALAKAGMRFENAYLTTSSCSPSRSSIITGRYPHNTGAPELHTTLPKGQVLFPKLLRESGYYTVLSGKNHMGGYATSAFDKVSRGKGPGAEEDWVQLLSSRPKDKPFFCWFASTDAHRDWRLDDSAPKYSPSDVIVPEYLVDGPETRADLTGYYHEVSRVDHYVGQVAEELKRQGVLDNTLLIFIADNGRPFPRCKTRLYDSGIKTPMIVHFPRRVKPAVTKSIVSVIDISATMLELAGVEKDKRIQGASFLPVLKDPKATTRDVAFAEHNWHVYQSHERMVRHGKWLYIRNNFPNKQNLCVEAYKGGAGKELWDRNDEGKLTPVQAQLFRNPCPAEELFDVTNDPHQVKNLAADEAHAETLRQMRSVLARWTAETGDTVPKDPTRDRDAPRKKISRKGFRHREMPGATTGADKIVKPGPVRINQ